MSQNLKQRGPGSRLAWALGLLCLLLVTLGPMTGLGSAPEPQMVSRPGKMIELRAGDTNAFTSVRPSAEFAPNRRRPDAANITVSYDDDFPAEARAAFDYAINIWEAQLTSPVEIVVNASWEDLGRGVLGSAGPYSFLASTDGGASNPLRPNTWYPYALADKLVGADLRPGDPDIVAEFNSERSDWYFGTDGNPPAGTSDFVSVVLHELGHGLGFIGSAEIEGGQGSLGRGTPWPFIYDVFTETGEGQALWSYPNHSYDLAAAFTSNDLFVDSPSTVAVLGGNRPRIYAPNPFEEGSSYSHWDEETFPPGHPDSLMTGYLARAEAIHDPGSLTWGFFRDMGWGVENSTPPTPTATATSTTPSIPLDEHLFLPMVRRG